MNRFPPLNKPRVARYVLRFVVGAAMIQLAAVLTDAAPIAVHAAEFFHITVDYLRGALFIGGIGLWCVPTQNSIALFVLTVPLLMYSTGAVDGVRVGLFQEQVGVVYFLLSIMFVILYWRDT